MALFTEKEIEGIIKSVFPAAEIIVWEDLEIGPYDQLADVPPGDWIDRVEKELLREEEESGLSYRLVAQLNAVLRVDTLGRQAFVPADYAERYGWPMPEIDSAEDLHVDPPFDNVPPDDVVNPEWAMNVIFASFPEAELTADDSGALMLDPDVYWVGDGAGHLLFSNDADEAIGDGHYDETPGVTIWEREIQRFRRLRKAVKEVTEHVDRSLSVSDRIAVVTERLRLLNLLEGEEEDALRLAEIQLRSPAQIPLQDVLAAGESETVEFKVTARCEWPDGEKSDRAKAEMVKAVAALMNTRGGVFVAGVHDNGHVVGIEPDLKRLKGRHETLLRNVTTELGAALGIEHVSLYVTASIENGDPDVLTIRAAASQRRVYAMVEGHEFFCVRSGPSTLELSRSQTEAYVEQRWGRGASELNDRE